jgi:UDP-N-acetylglucosamine 3-dehydrogenase
VSKRVKTAVIGAGNMGRNHLRVLAEISELQAVVDVVEATGKAQAKAYGVRYYPDFREMLEKEQIEAVTIAVPTKFHAEVATETVKRHIPTLVEKPITNSLVQAKALIKLARQEKVYLTVGHVERFNPSIQKLKQLIDQKKLGEIVSLLAIRVGIAPPPSKGSDVVIDLAIHDIDVFNYLMGKYPTSASVTRKKIFNSSFADVAALKLDYNKAVGLIQTNWITPVKMRRLYITGTSGFAEVDYIKQELTIYDKAVEYKPMGDFFDIVSRYSSPKKEVYISKEEPLKLEMEYFLGNITQGKPDVICASALKALEVTFSG